MNEDTAQIWSEQKRGPVLVESFLVKLPAFASWVILERSPRFAYTQVSGNDVMCACCLSHSYGGSGAWFFSPRAIKQLVYLSICLMASITVWSDL